MKLILLSCAPRVHRLTIVAHTVIIKLTTGTILVIFPKPCDDFEILVDTVLRYRKKIRPFLRYFAPVLLWHKLD